MSTLEMWWFAGRITASFVAMIILSWWCAGLLRGYRVSRLAQTGRGWISIRNDAGCPTIDRILSRRCVRNEKEWNKVIATQNGDREALQQALEEDGVCIIIGEKRDGIRPIRLQRQAYKGWRMPDNSVFIGPGTKYENPFSVKEFGCEDAAKSFELLMGEQGAEIFPDLADRRKEILDLLPDLRGKNLVDWCGVLDPCHGDWYLEHANA